MTSFKFHYIRYYAIEYFYLKKRVYIIFSANISAFIFLRKSHAKILFKTLISKFLAYFFMKYIVLDPLLDRQMLRKRILLRKCNFLSSRKQNNYNNLMIMMIFLIVSSMIKKTIADNKKYYILYNKIFYYTSSSFLR